MNIVAAIQALFTKFDPIQTINAEQANIVAVTLKAEEDIAFSKCMIEYATDQEIENIRTVVGTAFGRITGLVGTGAVHSDALKAVSKAKKQIEDALKALDEAI